MKRALIVEDEIPLQSALAELLSESGFDCLLAQNGEEGLSLALAEKPDILVVDVMMPKKDGFEMLRELRNDAWGVSVPVVILTNMAPNSFHTIKSVVETSPAYYIEKSEWAVKDIVDKIKSLAVS